MLNTLFRSKPKAKFEASLTLLHLSNVPLVNGYLFIKWRQKSGGNASGTTQRVQITQHQARWNEEMVMEVTCSIDPETSVLENAWVQLSVRLEINGGKSYDVLGSVNVDLAEYAGNVGKPLSHKYLLRESMLNSTLEVSVAMKHVSGERIFKASTGDLSFSSQHLRQSTADSNDAIHSIATHTEEHTAVELATEQLAHVDVHPMGLNYRQLRFLAPDMDAMAAIAQAHEAVADVFREHYERLATPSAAILS